MIELIQSSYVIFAIDYIAKDVSRINVLTKEELRNNKANYIISLDGKR